MLGIFRLDPHTSLVPLEDTNGLSDRPCLTSPQLEGFGGLKKGCVCLELIGCRLCTDGGAQEGFDKDCTDAHASAEVAVTKELWSRASLAA